MPADLSIIEQKEKLQTELRQDWNRLRSEEFVKHQIQKLQNCNDPVLWAFWSKHNRLQFCNPNPRLRYPAWQWSDSNQLSAALELAETAWFSDTCLCFVRKHQKNYHPVWIKVRKAAIGKNVNRWHEICIVLQRSQFEHRFCNRINTAGAILLNLWRRSHHVFKLKHSSSLFAPFYPIPNDRLLFPFNPFI